MSGKSSKDLLASNKGKKRNRIPLMILRPGADSLEFQVVLVEAKGLTAINAFQRLCHDAGVELPQKELDRSGVKPNVTQEILWLGYLIYVLGRENSPYLEHVIVERIEMGLHLEYKQIHHPFLASAKAIELAELLALDTDDQSPDHQDAGMAEHPPAVVNLSDNSIVLHPDDVVILRKLNEARTTLTQYAIEETTRIARTTISTRLKRLREEGLTFRPNGERGGDAITEAGRAQLDQ